ncbi:MAG: hypothetical protein R3D51_19505 [Hyphomicrobiaceae bacterium]
MSTKSKLSRGGPRSPIGRQKTRAAKSRGLSFTALGPKNGRRCFWKVAATGDYSADCDAGRAYALQYLAYQEEAKDAGSLLQLIVADMPRGKDMSGIENAFLEMICFAAVEGAYRAREISRYWDRCRQDEGRFTQDENHKRLQ